MIIQKTEDYIPYAFLKRGRKSFKYTNINTNPDKFKYRYANDLFQKDEFLSHDEITSSRCEHSYSLNFLVGNGLIVDAINSRIWAILCINKDTNEEVFLIDNNWYESYIRRFKKFINSNGWNSRKQAILCSNLNPIFETDLLIPEMEDYDEENQSELSSEFINNKKLEYAE